MKSLFIIGALIAPTLAYPVKFASDNEAFVPEELPASTPDKTFDADDAGGYVYTYILVKDYADYWNTGEEFFPFPDDGVYAGKITDFYSPHLSTYSQHLLKITFGAPPIIPADTWNCTAGGLTFKSGDFSGKVNGESVCASGACCGPLIGVTKFSDDQANWEEWLNNLVDGGSCKGDMYETLYCVLVDGHWRSNCFDRYVSATEMSVVVPCYDCHVQFWLDCTVFAATGADFGMDIEPAKYDAKLSIEQSLVLEVFGNNLDTICNPYSYFFPASSTSGDTETSAANYVLLLSYVLVVFVALI